MADSGIAAIGDGGKRCGGLAGAQEGVGLAQMALKGALASSAGRWWRWMRHRTCYLPATSGPVVTAPQAPRFAAPGARNRRRRATFRQARH